MIKKYDARMPPRIPIATAALVRDGLILLAHRHPDRRWYPDCWDLVGGHIEAGETAAQAVIRECREELGIRIRDPRPVPMAFSDPTIELHAYLVDRWDGTPVNAAPDEHDQLGWFAPDELAKLKLADPASLPDILNLMRLAQDPAGLQPEG
ncbi:NUDIX domain-containing protein [Microlunatus parietis]|uniref:8-oxo-dGTP pyrophosphatase MutT (NUDIX family) n=2 Tax=Microlunatus parietis TaxID=682979 RepID=A0A7Y9L6L6_9ACTN|nr:8-oxo-dGTP pyrophosphatase MutT (NUDIX family) [Microlunatus parietis]